MAPRTVQQLFGLKPEELNALTVLSGLEGFRGGKGQDVAAVAATTLARRLHGGWGGIDIRNIATAPGQFAAILDRGITAGQLADPAFGARILGGQEEFNRLRNIVNDPLQVRKQYINTKGGQSFRGVTAYGNRKPGDYMPIPGQSNFYFDPLGASQYQRGLQIFNQAVTPAPTQAPVAPTPPTPPQPPVQSTLSSILGLGSEGAQRGKSLAQQFLDTAIRNMIPQGIIPNIFGSVR